MLETLLIRSAVVFALGGLIVGGLVGLRLGFATGRRERLLIDSQARADRAALESERKLRAAIVQQSAQREADYRRQQVQLHRLRGRLADARQVLNGPAGEEDTESEASDGEDKPP